MARMNFLIGHICTELLVQHARRPRCGPTEPASSWRTGSRPTPMPTRSWSWTVAASSSRATITNCWPASRGDYELYSTQFAPAHERGRSRPGAITGLDRSCDTPNVNYALVYATRDEFTAARPA